MIFGLGRRFVGGWKATRGSISNGFAAGREFKVEGPEYGDLPDYEIWTDWEEHPVLTPEGYPARFGSEEYIVHSGGWLSAIARWRRYGPCTTFASTIEPVAKEA
jgi:hypothetical protein